MTKRKSNILDKIGSLIVRKINKNIPIGSGD